jgi:hypothetical protein
VQDITEAVKTATAFLVFIVTLIGVPTAYLTLRKTSLEAIKLRSEIEALKQNNSAVPQQIKAIRTTILEKQSQEIQSYNSIYGARTLTINLILMTSTSTLFVSLISPFAAAWLSAGIVEAGWPNGTLPDIIFRAVYGVFPNFSAIASALLCRNAAIKQQKWFRGHRQNYQMPPPQRYVIIATAGFAAGFATLVALASVEFWYYSAHPALGRYIEGPVLFGIVASICSLFYCIFIDMSFVGVARFKIVLASAIFLASFFVINALFSVIVYSSRTYGINLIGAMLFDIIFYSIFSLVIVVGLWIFTPQSTKRAKQA